MEKRLFFLIDLAQRNLLSLANDVFKGAMGLTATESAAVMIIAKRNDCALSELAQLLRVSSTRALQLTSSLKRKDLIYRKSIKVERNDASPEFSITLTESGNQRLLRILAFVDNLNAQISSEFSDHDIKVILRFLNFISSEINQPSSQ